MPAVRGEHVRCAAAADAPEPVPSASVAASGGAPVAGGAAKATSAPPSVSLQWAHFGAALGAFLVADRMLVNAAVANGAPALRLAQPGSAMRCWHDGALTHLCVRAGVTFPPPLLGMFALIAALALTEARGGTAAVDRVAAAAAPGVDWIGRWLPLFYVPSLVTLPLALMALPGALVAKVRVP